MLYFAALGAMEIRNEVRSITISGVLQQTLLATFLASYEKLLTADDLVEELWGTTPPARTENALHAQISRLRRTIAQMEPERDGSRIIRTASGYRLSLDGAEFDGALLHDAVNSIRARDGKKSRDDARDLRAVLDLQRGPAFGGIVGGPICQNAVVRYREYRTAAQVLLYKIEMSLGENSRIVPELSALVEEAPFQESFCGLLMVALYRSGRQADALAVARQLRSRLIDEMGIEPEPTLGLLEKAILNHDQDLLEQTVLSSR